MSMQLTDIDRIERLVSWSKLTSNAFAKKIGYERGQLIYDLLKGKNKISRKVATKICNAYPEISLSWILTGEGSMLKDKPETETTCVNEPPAPYTNHENSDTISRSEYEFIRKLLLDKIEENKMLRNLLSSKNSEFEEGEKKEAG